MAATNGASKSVLTKETPEDGVKIAKELAEEVREETGVQLDPDAWQQPTGADDAGGPANLWYFAFGSNMNKSVFEGRRMIKPAESAPAVLPGYRLCFSCPGLPYREPAFASVEPIPANDDDGHNGAQQEAPEVHGVVHRITPRQWQHIQETEGAAGHSEFGYGAVSVPVRTYDGRTVQAFTLITQPKSVAFLKGRRALPSQRYLSLVQAGAKESSLDPAYQEYLASLPAYQPGRSLGSRLGKLLMAAMFFLLVAPAFAFTRLWAKFTGLEEKGAARTGSNGKKGDSSSESKHGPGGLRARLMARYLHAVFSLAWAVHHWVEPLLGCGCTNGQAAAKGGKQS
ncbi:hypothetical protein N2152v2_003642 [Parachlorella kessleri]